VLKRNTAGSALVRLAETRVLAATTLQVGRVSASLPKHGEVEVNASMGPVCGPRFRASGRSASGGGSGSGAAAGNASGSDAQIVESLVQRVISTSGLLDTEELCIRDGLCAWKIVVSIVCLNHDGNVEDAALLAAVSALEDTVLPGTVVGEDGKVCLASEGKERNQRRAGESVSLSCARPLKLRCIPVPLTIGMFDGKLMVDPCSQEEDLLEAVLTVVLTTQGAVVAVNKPGGAAFSPEDMAVCMRLGLGRATEMEPLITSNQTR